MSDFSIGDTVMFFGDEYNIVKFDNYGAFLKNEEECYAYACFDFISKVACENEIVECDKEELFKRITGEMFSLYSMKNKNYGNSFSKSFEEFGMAMPCIRLSDKIERLKSLVKQGEDADCDDESIVDTLIDTSIYAIMTIMELEERK